MNHNFDETQSIELTTGHLLFLWETITQNLSGEIDSLSEEEKRAIWGLEDLLENKLIEIGIKALPQAEWQDLIESARDHMASVPVEFR